MQPANQPAGARARICALLLLPLACTIADADVGALDAGEASSSSGAADSDGSFPGTSTSTTSASTTSASTTSASSDDGVTTEANTSGDGETTGDESSSDGAITTGALQCCVEQTLSWGTNGGLLPVSSFSAISDCDVFLYSYDNNVTDEIPAEECSSTLACDGDNETIVASDIVAYLNDPELQKVVDAGPHHYGGNTEPIDFPSFHIQIGDVNVSVGNGCGGGGGPLCTAIPPALEEFTELLQALTAQQQAADASCPP